jgi:hypothetical protein
MKRRILIALLIGMAVTLPVSAQNFTGLKNDLTTLFEKIGEDMLPQLQHVAKSGDALGGATLPENRRFFAALSTGAVFSDGVSDSLNEAEYDVIDATALLDDALSDAGPLQDLYQDFLPYPMLRASFGVGLPRDIEVAGMVAFFPQGLSSAIGNAAGIDGLEFSTFNAGVRARKTLLASDGWIPAVSMGLGYSFAGFGVGYALPTVEQDDLTLTGDLELDGTVHTAGLDFAVSERIGFFVPFVKLSPYFQAASYEGGIKNIDATLGTGGSASSYDKGDPIGKATNYDFALEFGTGFELNFGPFGLIAEGTYGTAAEAFGADLAMRFQF